MRTGHVWKIALLAVVIVVAAPAGAAPPAGPSPAGPAPVVALSVPVLPAPSPPAPLAALIAKKKPFDAAKLASRLSMVNGRPTLKVASGKQVALMPATKPISATPVVNAELKAKLAKYSPYLKARTLGPAKSTAAAPVPRIVDHRPFQTPIKDQRDFGTCTMFAMSAGIEMVLKKSFGATHDISEADAWRSLPRSSCNGDGVHTWQAAAKLSAVTVCGEAQMPYTGAASDCGGVNSQCEANKRYGISGYANFTGSAYASPDVTEFANDTNLIESALDLGLPVVVGVHMVGNGWHDGSAENGVVDREAGDNSYFGNHAMLVVGYNQQDDYFVLKNSWGTSFGRGGYVYVSYEYMQSLVFESTIIVGVRNPG
ncbi:MAG: C1 family peptidase [Deltaproteobacteria bacterium]|nr:C1 family peptidase [Deltaproteobacteria bacterium]